MSALFGGVDLGDEGFDQRGELGFGSSADFHDFFVVDGFVENAGGHVGDEREAEDFEAHVAGYDDFVDRGHADEVGAEGAEGADFCGGFVAGAEDGEVDAFGEWDVLAGGFGGGELAEARGSRRWTCRRSAGRSRGCAANCGSLGPRAALVPVRLMWSEMQTRPPWPKLLLMPPAALVTMSFVQPSMRENARGEDDFGHRVAFVGVDAALHDGDGDAGDGAEDELAGVALHGGLRPVGDFGVGDDGGVFDLRGEVAEAGAEDDAERRLEVARILPRARKMWVRAWVARVNWSRVVFGRHRRRVSPK